MFLWPKICKNWRNMSNLAVFHYFDPFQAVWGKKNSILPFSLFLRKNNILRIIHGKNFGLKCSYSEPN